MCGRGCNDCNTTLLRRSARVTPARPGAVNTSSDQGAWILFEQSSQDEKENRCTCRAFAITLQFYSTKAYNFVRDTFGLGLPAVSTLRGWYRSVDGNVGFNASVMQSLENKVKEVRKQGNEVLCSLMLDEMAIMKKIEFDGKKTFGFVDIGSAVTNDGAPAATQALVFMVVCVNGSWKFPIGFFSSMA
ncbi:THAP domain containing 9 [Plakobranchus ocellatus]|uniref:THAP domain containing 9 n=1 Tax=Plakobranchus ocellatus TaxID=259542 RepID=A0AAV4CIH1_9GAST|nr:THAP domain containing 9 [Plakobranchus ocellatus]